MTVYVDSARIPARVGRTSGRWSHLTADSKEELVAFAQSIGLRRAWFQTCKYSRSCRPAERCDHWHFDVIDSKRGEALAAGAQPMDIRRWQMLVRARKDQRR
jgi:hypothetical protein